MDRFIRVNGKEFSFEEVAKALGFEVAPHLDPVQVHLCQQIEDGVLVAKGAFFDKDDYPGMDVELELPEEKDSMPVIISRTEQPRLDTEERGVRTFCYNRENEYFMYFDVDTRTDDEVDKEIDVPSVVLSGSRLAEVDVYEENTFVRYRGALPAKERAVEPAMDNVKLEVGMVGSVKGLPEIKKNLRGKAFEITGVNEEHGFAACKIEGEQGTFSIHVSQMENLCVPEISLEDTLVNASMRSGTNVASMAGHESVDIEMS